MLDQTKTIHTHLVQFYKWAKYENEGYKELLKIRNNFGINYIKKKKEIYAKKEALFQKGERDSKLSKDYNEADASRKKSLIFESLLPKVENSKEFSSFRKRLFLTK